MKILKDMICDFLPVFVGVYLALFLFWLTFLKKVYIICVKNMHLNANYYASMQGGEPEDILAEANDIFEEPEKDQVDFEEDEEEPGARYE